MAAALTSERRAVTRPLGAAFVLTWLPSVTMMLLTTLSYIDRNTLAILAPTILGDTGLSNAQYGFVISGFSIAYMFGNPLWGRIVDRVGVRASMTVAVFLWTLASVSHALAGGVRGFLAARIWLGLGEAATYPGGVRVAAQTLPPAKRMRGVALAYSGGSLGALITPILVTPLAAAWGWRGAFWATGALGLLWLGLWAGVSRRPDLARPGVAGASESRGELRWNDRGVWAFMSLFALGASPLGFVLYQSSLYLSSVLHKSQLEIGYVLWIPPLSWEAGFFFWGWMIDRLAQTSTWRARLRWLFLAQALLVLPLAAIPYVHSFPSTIAMLSLAMFVAPGPTVGGIAYAVKHYSTSHSGLIAGLGSGAWSAVLALEMPVVGRLFDLRSYGWAFALATLLPIVGYAVWRVLDGGLSRDRGTLAHA
jgi:ACS family hexuronate transporter-like MFS transporter